MEIAQNPRKSCKKMRIKFLKSTWFFDNFESLNIFSIGSVFFLSWNLDNFDSQTILPSEDWVCFYLGILTTLIPKQFYHLVTGSVFALKFWQLWFPKDFLRSVCFCFDNLTTLTPNRIFFRVSLFLGWHFDNFDSLKNFLCVSVFGLIFWRLWLPEEFPLCLCFCLDILTTLTPSRFFHVCLFFWVDILTTLTPKWFHMSLSQTTMLSLNLTKISLT